MLFVQFQHSHLFYVWLSTYDFNSVRISLGYWDIFIATIQTGCKICINTFSKFWDRISLYSFWLVWTSLYRPGWAETHRPASSASWALRSEAGATVLDACAFVRTVASLLLPAVSWKCRLIEQYQLLPKYRLWLPSGCKSIQGNLPSPRTYSPTSTLR